MGLISYVKSKFSKADELKELKTERAGGVGFRIAKQSMRNYTVKMSMSYDGKPMRKFEVILKAKSRANAAFLAKQKITTEVVSAQLIKK